MKYLLGLLVSVSLISCGGSSDSTSENDEEKKFQELLSKYHQIPAFPFQFTFGDLHSDTAVVSTEEKSKYFNLGENQTCKAVHYYELYEQYVLFTLWYDQGSEVPTEVTFRADLFDKNGEIVSTVQADSYNFYENEYILNPKFELWQDSLSLIYEEMYFVKDTTDISEETESILYRSFYAETYVVSLNGFEMVRETPFWMKIPRNYFSPFMQDLLRKDGMWDHQVTESDRSFENIDASDGQFRTMFYEFSNGLIGVSSSFPTAPDSKDIISTFAILDMTDKQIVNRTDELLGEFKEEILSNGCPLNAFGETKTGKINKFGYQRFEDDNIMFYSMDANQPIGEPTFQVKLNEQGKFEVRN